MTHSMVCGKLSRKKKLDLVKVKDISTQTTTYIPNPTKFHSENVFDLKAGDRIPVISTIFGLVIV
jgi:hypothetical protein